MPSPSSDLPAHGFLGPGRIYVRGLGKPSHITLASGITTPFAGAQGDAVSATQWAQCIGCSQTYMTHQGSLLAEEKIPNWPIPVGAVIEFAPNNQWDCNQIEKEQVFFIKPVDYLRWFVPGSVDIPWYIAAQLRETAEIVKPIAEWVKLDNKLRVSTEAEKRHNFQKATKW